MLNYEEEARLITLALNGHWHGNYGVACCPAHKDTSPSLALSNGNDGRLLVHCHAGCSFTDIMDALRQKGIIEAKTFNDIRHQNLTQTTIKNDFNNAASAQKASAARKLWQETVPIKDTLAEHYLRGRSINCSLPQSLRFHNHCRHPNGDYFPAMIALVEGGCGFAVHRTYLTNAGNKVTITPAKAMLGRVAGGAVYLTNNAGNDRFIICEGIETGLSLNCGMLSKPANIWAALSTSGMKAINLPSRAGELIIAFDSDKAGLEAGKALIDKAKGIGWEIKTATPPQGQDFNDVLQSMAQPNNKGGEA